MITKRIPINVLLSEEVNDGLLDVGEKLGMNKSKTIRFICLDYLTKNNVLANEETTLIQNL
jgi:hypothetical protein